MTRQGNEPTSATLANVALRLSTAHCRLPAGCRHSEHPRLTQIPRLSPASLLSVAADSQASPASPLLRVVFTLRLSTPARFPRRC